MTSDNLSGFFGAFPPAVQFLSGLGFLAAAAFLANILIKQLILKLIRRGMTGLSVAIGGEHLEPIVRRLANIVPALVISRGILLVPHIPGVVVAVTQNVVSAFIVLTIVLAINAALDVINILYQQRPDAMNRPIKGYVQVVKILLFAGCAILVIAALMEKSPLLLLSGLGAMAAVLMLVFKDTILSLVASVQLTSNDMLRVGDWIEMPQLNADGDVVDIALHTVKVQNWDKTITSVPTYRLISESYKNWRGMSESGGRRIMRALRLDQNSVRFLTARDKEELSRFTLLEPYLQRKRDEILKWNAGLQERGDDLVNQRELTNLGTFRAYVRAYLENNPRIHGEMTLLVRLLEPTAEGLPLQIYCFTNTTAWTEYEAIQGDLFDHLLAILPHFGLRVFQQPSGADVRDLADTGIPRRQERATA